jgi:hypothetical protein
MQGLASTREKPPVQEQWLAMEKTMRRTMETTSGRIDLQWITGTVCNVRFCKGERNANGARTMGSNGKTMRRAMETIKKGLTT